SARAISTSASASSRRSATLASGPRSRRPASCSARSATRSPLPEQRDERLHRRAALLAGQPLLALEPDIAEEVPVGPDQPRRLEPLLVAEDRVRQQEPSAGLERLREPVREPGDVVERVEPAEVVDGLADDDEVERPLVDGVELDRVRDPPLDGRRQAPLPRPPDRAGRDVDREHRVAEPGEPLRERTRGAPELERVPVPTSAEERELPVVALAVVVGGLELPRVAVAPESVEELACPLRSHWRRPSRPRPRGRAPTRRPARGAGSRSSRRRRSRTAGRAARRPARRRAAARPPGGGA